MAISTGVSSSRRSAVVGLALRKGNFLESTPFLPQKIVVLGEANSANQTNLPLSKEVTSAAEVGESFGYGSPLHSIARILFPVSGGGVNGIPVVMYPQAEAGGAVASEQTVTITGTVTKNTTHYLRVNGRESIDGLSYAYSVITTDTPTTIAAKIADIINNVIFAPVSATSALGVVTSVSKWKSVTSNEIEIAIETNGNDNGLTYVVDNESVTGVGVANISSALSNFGSTWNTIVLNSYGTATFDLLESVNGIPGDLPSGRYTPIQFKPFISLWGSTLDDKDDLAAITDATARKTQVTNALCPAPLSEGFPWEAAANGTVLFANVSQNSPHLGVDGPKGMRYPDMPIPIDEKIGDMEDYNNRDFLVKKGCSTVELDQGAYAFRDFVTTYHPDGEVPLQFAYCRNLMIDFNIAFGYKEREKRVVLSKAVTNDAAIVSIDNVVKPSTWKAELYDFADDLQAIALIADAEFMKNSIQVELAGGDNPDRFETFFRYKRTGFARIASTDMEAGFFFN